MAEKIKTAFPGLTIEVDPDWRIYGDIDLSKSCVGSEDHADYWYLQGMILTADKDTAGETPILKSMDWSYFDTQGFVKYEHDPNGIPNPRNIIGIPHLRKSLPNGEYLRAKLLPRPVDEVQKGLVEDYARSTAALIKAVQEHNQLHPDKQRTIGFSIEGKYLGKSDKDHYWGKVINVVVSPNPVGIKTYAEMSKAHNSEMIKSLMTGASFGVTDQTGGAALRKESIKDELVSTTFGDKNQGVKTMKFKNLEEAKKHYLGEGLEEDEAIKKAKSHFPDDEGSEEENEVEKSTKESKSVMMKALEVIQSLVKSHKVEPSTNEKEEEDLEKSQTADAKADDQELVDITPIFQEYGAMMKSILAKSDSLQNYIEAYNAEMAKILTAFSDGHNSNTEMIKSMKTEIDTLKKSLEVNNKILKAIGLSARDISFLNLDQEKVVDEDGGNGKISKSVILQRLDLAMRKGMISPLEITKFEMTGKLPAHITMDSLPQLGN